MEATLPSPVAVEEEKNINEDQSQSRKLDDVTGRVERLEGIDDQLNGLVEKYEDGRQALMEEDDSLKARIAALEEKLGNLTDAATETDYLPELRMLATSTPTPGHIIHESEGNSINEEQETRYVLLCGICT